MLALHLLNTIKHGGAENVALNYAKVLNKMEISSVFVGKIISKDYAETVQSVGKIKCQISIRALYDADIIFIHSNVNLLRIFIFRIFPLKWKKKKVIYVQHLLYKESKFRKLAILINAVCTDFIQITPITKDLIKKYIKIKTNFIVNFYLNKYKECKWPEIRNEVRKSLNIDKNQIIITYSSILKPGKNVSDFIRLAKEGQCEQNWTFLLMGDGVESDKVKSYNASNLIWLGFVNDVEKYLIASDVFVFLSKQEMMPMSLIEAINTEKKIVCYNTEVNNYLMNGRTYDSISSKLFFKGDIPSGKDLTHYDESYALQKLSDLINHLF